METRQMTKQRRDHKDSEIHSDNSANPRPKKKNRQKRTHDSDYSSEESEDSENEELIQQFIQKHAAAKLKIEIVPLNLSQTEAAYFKKQTKEKQAEILKLMDNLSTLVTDCDIPYKFRVLQLPISDYIKSNVIRKIDSINQSNDNGEIHKLRNWVDAFMRIPFGKTVPIPVKLEDGEEKCTNFMVESKQLMNNHIYGMESAKLQIMQIIAQWIANPSSAGNVIALHGPMGVGKTGFARNAIAEVLKRPFEFFTLGGASDIAHFTGHSYTYEGSLWGRIVDSLIHAKTMNPVMYFDELDKISTTPQGDEIVSMMIHMTDRSQNSQFHDRYFSGVDFDISQCLFVFSFNDIDKVHPILRDRMTVIHCGGYNEKEKIIILKNYIWPSIVKRLNFKETDVMLTDNAVHYMVTEFSSDEKGVRTLIRAIDNLMMRINMMRIVRDDSMKEYKFYMDICFPLLITEETAKKIMSDTRKKEFESWRNMYT